MFISVSDPDSFFMNPDLEPGFLSQTGYGSWSESGYTRIRILFRIRIRNTDFYEQLNLFQYASKSRAFGHAGMIVRGALTCIDANKNLMRGQVISSQLDQYIYEVKYEEGTTIVPYRCQILTGIFTPINQSPVNFFTSKFFSKATTADGKERYQTLTKR